jgi:hypothetical protein
MSQVQGRRFEKGEEVWVPIAEVRKSEPNFSAVHEGAMVTGKLAGRVEGALAPGTPRTWHVAITGLLDANSVQKTIEVSSRRFLRHAKILIIRIGDWETEQVTLNPLAESLKAQLSLLLPPSGVDVEYIRTLDELRAALELHGGGLTSTGRRQSNPWGYAVLVGHGRAGTTPGIRFGHSWNGPDEIQQTIQGLGPGRRTFSEGRFISLCCETGISNFAAPFSDALNTTWVGPRAEVHSYEAAGFVQRLFFEHFLSGQTWMRAFRSTAETMAGFSTQFQCWMDGDEI